MTDTIIHNCYFDLWSLKEDVQISACNKLCVSPDCSLFALYNSNALNDTTNNNNKFIFLCNTKDGMITLYPITHNSKLICKFISNEIFEYVVNEFCLYKINIINQTSTCHIPPIKRNSHPSIIFTYNSYIDCYGNLLITRREANTLSLSGSVYYYDIENNNLITIPIEEYRYEISFNSDNNILSCYIYDHKIYYLRNQSLYVMNLAPNEKPFLLIDNLPDPHYTSSIVVTEDSIIYQCSIGIYNYNKKTGLIQNRCEDKPSSADYIFSNNKYVIFYSSSFFTEAFFEIYNIEQSSLHIISINEPLRLLSCMQIAKNNILLSYNNNYNAIVNMSDLSLIDCFYNSNNLHVEKTEFARHKENLAVLYYIYEPEKKYKLIVYNKKNEIVLQKKYNYDRFVSFCFSSDNKYLFISAVNMLYIYETNSYSLVKSLDFKGTIHYINYIGNRLVALFNYSNTSSNSADDLLRELGRSTKYYARYIDNINKTNKITYVDCPVPKIDKAINLPFDNCVCEYISNTNFCHVLINEKIDPYYYSYLALNKQYRTTEDKKNHIFDLYVYSTTRPSFQAMQPSPTNFIYNKYILSIFEDCVQLIERKENNAYIFQTNESVEHFLFDEEQVFLYFNNKEGRFSSLSMYHQLPVLEAKFIPGLSLLNCEFRNCIFESEYTATQILQNGGIITK